MHSKRTVCRIIIYHICNYYSICHLHAKRIIMNDVHKIHWFAYIQWSRFRYITYNICIRIYTIAICKHIVCTVRDIISCTASQVSPLSRNCWSLRCDPLRVSKENSYRYPLNLTTPLEQELTVDHPDPQKKLTSEFLLFLQESTYDVWSGCFMNPGFGDLRHSKGSYQNKTPVCWLPIKPLRRLWFPTILCWHRVLYLAKKTVNKTHPWKSNRA